MSRITDKLREHRDFPGLNKTEKQPYPKPKKIPDHVLSDNGSRVAKKLREAYAAPNTGNSNYAQNLPAAVDTTKKRIKAKLDKRDQASTADQVAEEDKDGGVTLRHYQQGVDHGLDGKEPSPPPDINHASAYMDGHRAGTKRRRAVLQHDRIHDEVMPVSFGPMVEEIITSLDDVQPILNEAAINESKVSAFTQGAIHGLRGHELPAEHVEKKFGIYAAHYHAGIAKGKQERNERSQPTKTSWRHKLGLATEELKVGDDDQEQKKVRGSNTKNGRVKRSYLGAKRGTTKTGKAAHAIEIYPVIDKPDPNINRTTPSGERKRT